MSVPALIYTYLTTPTLTGVEGRVFPHYLPYAERQPYNDDQVAISYEVTGANPVEDKYRPAGVDVLRVQVNAYGRYLEMCYQALDELRAYLDMRSHELIEGIGVQRVRWKDMRSLYNEKAQLAGRQDEYEIRIIKR